MRVSDTLAAGGRQAYMVEPLMSLFNLHLGSPSAGIDTCQTTFADRFRPI